MTKYSSVMFAEDFTRLSTSESWDLSIASTATLLDGLVPYGRLLIRR